MKNTKRTVLALLCLFVICVASSPSDPSPRTDEYWVETHALFKANTANNPDIPILFYGDSIMRRWIEDGRDVFYQYYEPVGVVNYGMGGEGIQNVLWRILNGEVRGLSPKLVVLKIGTNNLDTDGNQAIAKGIVNVVRSFRHQLPNTKILLLGILPRGGVAYFDRIAAINWTVRRLHDGQNVFFLDMFDQFRSDVWGVINGALYVDGLHLSTAGYELWAATMNPLFDQLIK